MDTLRAALLAAMNNVESVCATRGRERGQDGPTLWRGDSALRHNIRQLKVISEGLGAQCTKVSLLSLRSPSKEMFDSLAEEIAPQIEGYSHQFTNFSRCSVYVGLLMIIGKHMRTFLKTMLGLVELVQAAQYTDTPGITGKIHELAEAMKKLPVSNRVAYRRSLMEQVTSINETINEFQVHVVKYKTKNNSGDGDQLEQGQARGEDEDEDQDEDEDDDEEGEYTAEEVLVAEKVLNMLTFSSKVVKGSLIVVTDVADQLHPVVEDDNSTSTPALTTVFFSPPASEQQRGCQEWVARVIQAAAKIEKSAVSVGAELYSPCENPDDVRSQYNACLQDSFACLDLLVGTQNYLTMLGSSCREKLEELSAERLELSLASVQL